MVTTQSPPDQRMILHHVSWETYLRLLHDFENGSAPRLVIEIDIMHPSLLKLPIYARVGVPEVWRYVAGAMEILVLDGEQYVQVPSSRALPIVTAEALTALVRASRGLSQAERLRLVRERIGRQGTPNQ